MEVLALREDVGGLVTLQGLRVQAQEIAAKNREGASRSTNYRSNHKLALYK
ncbi:MAG: hypothetical protein R2784_14635 [Saprospiraceae bacterium]